MPETPYQMTAITEKFVAEELPPVPGSSVDTSMPTPILLISN